MLFAGLTKELAPLVRKIVEAPRRPDRTVLEREYEVCRERDDLSAARALHSLAWVELWTGRWELAADYADRAYDLTTQYGLEVPWAHLPVAVVAAHRGQHELARAHSERALQLGEEQFGRHTPVHVGTLGLVATPEKSGLANGFV